LGDKADPPISGPEYEIQAQKSRNLEPVSFMYFPTGMVVFSFRLQQ